MHISFDQIQNQTNTNMVNQQKTQKTETGTAGNGIMVDAFGTGNTQQNVFAYGKKETSMQDMQAQASMVDAADYKNYMAVMSHTMSEEDYKELTKDGVHPGKMEVSDAANIMDHIKANMAKAGVVIDGFNGEGDLSVEMLTEITQDAGFANAIVGSFAQNDIPVTEENVKDTVEATKQAGKIYEITDQMKQYLLQNNLPVTIDGLYKAMYSSAGNMQQNQGGYFADDTTGYFGKKPEQIDKQALEDQVIRMLEKSDIAVTEEIKEQAFWLLDHGILFTEENMEKLSSINEIKLPIEEKQLLNKIAGSIREGKAALDTNLAAEGIYEKAQRIYEQVQQISEESLQKAVQEGRTIHIRSLSNVQKQIALSVYTSAKDGSNQTELTAVGENSDKQEQFLHEKRMLEEVRLKMTISANIQLLKSNYAIDTAPLTQLVDALKTAEQRQADYGLTLSDAEETSLYQEAMEKRTALMDMPAAAISKVMSVSDEITLRALHEQGRILKSTYDKAGESYETLMTKPRADLGDRMKNAFGNIDALLSENNMEPSEENRRAVRILAYNQMEISADSIEKIADADQTIQELLSKMSPANTLQMIRDGINPLDASIEDLSGYFDSMENDPVQQAEKFSQFLYHLEQKNDITPEERTSFIGIYRLIRQVEKQDGKAIGRVVADGRELSFKNLLSAVRTGQKKPIDVTLDDSFGVLTDLETKGISIADQINAYFTFLKESERNTDWINESYQTFQEQMETTPAYVESLLSTHQLVTPDNLSAMKELSEKRGQLYRTAKEKLTKEDTDAEKAFDDLIDKVQESFVSKESATEAITDMTKQISQQLSETMYDEKNTYLDIKAITSMTKQLSLVANLSKEEVYEIPAVIDGEFTSASVTFVHDGKEEQPNARITITLTDGRQMMAHFIQDGGQIKGFIGCNDDRLKESLLQKQDTFSKSVLSETEKMVDISIIKGDVLSQIEHNKKQIAGTQGFIQNQADENQGGYVDASALYKTVRAFLRMVR